MHVTVPAIEPSPQAACTRTKRAMPRCLLLPWIGLLAVLFTLQPLPAVAADEAPGLPATPDLIDQAYASGQITAEERLLLLAYAIFEPASLPAAYESDTPWFGTSAVAELYATMDAVNAGAAQVQSAAVDELQQLLHTAEATVCNQQDGGNFVNTTNFHIDYATVGGGLTIQDYENSLEQAFVLEVVQYGWAKPPVCEAGQGDCARDNPWGRYPVQVAVLQNGLYGYVAPQGGSYARLIGDNPNTPVVESDAYASCMVLNRDYSGFAGGAQFSLDVTTAHEFVHAIQFGYGDPAPVEIDLWYESTAAYVEDEVLDEADDNYQYLWPAFNRCLGAYPARLSSYSNWIFFRYAAEHNGGTNVAGGGEELFQLLWENIGQGQGALDAYGNALREQGRSFADTYHDYAIAAGYLRACPDSAPYCFEEAAAYVDSSGFPQLHGQILAVGDSLTGALENHYALNWIELPVDDAYDVTFENLSAGGVFRISIVAQTDAGLDVTPFPDTVGRGGSVTLRDYAPPAAATFVMAVITNQEVRSANPTACAASEYRLSTEPALTPSGFLPVVLRVGQPPTCFPDPPGPTDNIDSARTLCSGQTINGALAEGDTDDVYRIEAEAGDLLEVQVSSNDGEVDLYLFHSDAADVSSDPWVARSRLGGGVESIRFVVPESGLWYIDLYSEETNVSYTLTAMLDENNGFYSCTPDAAADADNIDDAVRICSGQRVAGTVDPDDVDDVFRIAVPAGWYLSAFLAGTSGNADLAIYEPSATDIFSDEPADTSTGPASQEWAALALAEAGDWYVDIYAAEGSIDYELTVYLAETSTVTAQTSNGQQQADRRQR